MTRKVLVTGYYGFDNFGDDLFGLACVNGMKLHAAGSAPVILAPPITGISADYLVPDTLARIYRSRRSPGKLLRMVFMIYGCLKYGDLALAGGSVISSGSAFRMRKLQYWMAKLGLCRISAIGVSVGPFHSEKDRAAARQFLNCLSYIAVRDQASVEACRSLAINQDVHLFNDLAGCAPLPETRKAHRRRILGVSICNYETYFGGDKERERLRNEAITAGLAEFCVKNEFEVQVLVLNAHPEVGDGPVSEKLARDLRGRGIAVELLDYAGPEKSMEQIATCDILFSVRLHGAICAYLLSVPFGLVEYHNKCKDFMDYVGCDADRRFSADISDKDVIVERLDNILQSGARCEVDPAEYREKSSKIFSCSPWVSP